MAIQNIHDKESLLWYLWKEAYSNFQNYEGVEGLNITRKDTRENGEELRELILKHFDYDVLEHNGRRYGLKK